MIITLSKDITLALVKHSCGPRLKYRLSQALVKVARFFGEENPAPLGMPQTILIVGPNQHLGHPK